MSINNKTVLFYYHTCTSHYLSYTQLHYLRIVYHAPLHCIYMTMHCYVHMYNIVLYVCIYLYIVVDSWWLPSPFPFPPSLPPHPLSTSPSFFPSGMVVVVSLWWLVVALYSNSTCTLPPIKSRTQARHRTTQHGDRQNILLKFCGLPHSYYNMDTSACTCTCTHAHVHIHVHECSYSVVLFGFLCTFRVVATIKC